MTESSAQRMTAADQTLVNKSAANKTAEIRRAFIPNSTWRRAAPSLIILLGAIGDVVRALPLLGRLRRAWPSAHIAWAVEPKSQAVLEGHPWLDQLIIYESPPCPALIPALPDASARGPFRSDARPPAPSQERSRLKIVSGAGVVSCFDRSNGKEFNHLFSTLQKSRRSRRCV